MLITRLIAAWQDACDLIVLTEERTIIRLNLRDRSYIADKLNRPVKVRPELGLVFPL